jgi:hypothetical protein
VENTEPTINEDINLFVDVAIHDRRDRSEGVDVEDNCLWMRFGLGALLLYAMMYDDDNEKVRAKTNKAEIADIVKNTLLRYLPTQMMLTMAVCCCCNITVPSFVMMTTEDETAEPNVRSRIRVLYCIRVVTYSYLNVRPG